MSFKVPNDDTKVAESIGTDYFRLIFRKLMDKEQHRIVSNGIEKCV